MLVEDLPLPDLLLITPPRHEDARGFFCETYNAAAFRQATGLDPVFVQDNHSLSRQAFVLRGLHAQAPPHDQAKLVRVSRGRIFDVAVDFRRSSSHFGRWFGVELDAETGRQLFLPRGFLHGFVTLVPDTEVQYKVDNVYVAAAECGVLWSDPDLGIAWPLDGRTPLVSDKDRALPPLKAAASPFP